MFDGLKKWLESNQTVKEKGVPEEIFSNIVGHEDAKAMLTMALEAEKPVHILLKGPFGIGKTELMQCVKEYVGEKNCHWAIGSRTSKAGLSDMFIKNPNIQYLFIDEFERLKPDDQGVLLSAMQDGVISETLYGKTKGRQVKVNVRVFASANDTRRILRALQTRFTIVNMEGYTEEQFVNIAQALAVSEGVTTETIADIAVAVYRTFFEPNPRDVVHIARLSKGNKDKIITCLTVLRKKTPEERKQ